MKTIKILLLFCFCVLSALAANAQNQASDVDGSNEQAILNVLEIWEDWHQEQTIDNMYIGDFMVENQVPTSGMNGLNRRETWYWWISNNSQKIEDFNSIHKDMNN